jgi:hypothetical protein
MKSIKAEGREAVAKAFRTPAERELDRLNERFEAWSQRLPNVPSIPLRIPLKIEPAIPGDDDYGMIEYRAGAGPNSLFASLPVPGTPPGTPRKTGTPHVTVGTSMGQARVQTILELKVEVARERLRAHLPHPRPANCSRAFYLSQALVNALHTLQRAL